jgi:hypothetical protein
MDMGPPDPAPVFGFGRHADGMGVSALTGAIAAPVVIQRGGMGAARWLRSILSLLAAAAVVAIALPVAFSSGAGGAGVDSVQVFSSGPLLSTDTSGGARLSMAGIVPGESRSATIRVSNDGAGPALLSVSAHLVDQVGPGGAPLSGALALRVEAVGSGAAPLYSGPIGAMPRLRLGGIAAGAERDYRVSVTLPASVGNEIRGSSLSAAFAWVAA